MTKMILTNKTNERRVVRFGVADIVVPPLSNVEVPKEQEAEARRSLKSKMWQRLLDAKIFSVDCQKSLTESEITVTPKVKAPEELKQFRKGRAKVTSKPTLDGSSVTI